jgi:hypothetical protein
VDHARSFDLLQSPAERAERRFQRVACAIINCPRYIPIPRPASPMGNHPVIICIIVLVYPNIVNNRVSSGDTPRGDCKLYINQIYTGVGRSGCTKRTWLSRRHTLCRSAFTGGNGQSCITRTTAAEPIITQLLAFACPVSRDARARTALRCQGTG